MEYYFFLFRGEKHFCINALSFDTSAQNFKYEKSPVIRAQMIISKLISSDLIRHVSLRRIRRHRNSKQRKGLIR
jgi:hypothetical protein